MYSSFSLDFPCYFIVQIPWASAHFCNCCGLLLFPPMITFLLVSFARLNSTIPTTLTPSRCTGTVSQSFPAWSQWRHRPREEVALPPRPPPPPPQLRRKSTIIGSTTAAATQHELPASEQVLFPVSMSKWTFGKLAWNMRALCNQFKPLQSTALDSIKPQMLWFWIAPLVVVLYFNQ